MKTCAVCIDIMAEESAYSTSVLDGAQLQKPGLKRRRVADDYKRAVVQVRDTGRASSSQQFLRAAQTASEKCAFAWNEKDLLQHQSASWYSAAAARHVTLTFDGGRFGNPATETLVCIASFRSGVHVHGVWLPPQSLTVISLHTTELERVVSFHYTSCLWFEDLKCVSTTVAQRFWSLHDSSGKALRSHETTQPPPPRSFHFLVHLSGCGYKSNGFQRIYIPSQIMDDWVKSVPKIQTERTKREQNDAIARQLQEFMREGADLEGGEETSKEPEALRLYSAHHLQAIEQALQAGLNLTLTHFRCAGSHAVIRSDVKRYWTPRERLTAELVEDGITRRACVQLQPSGTTSLTVPRDPQKENRGLASLTCVMDMGPKQFPGMQWVFESWQLRGCLINDPWHADWNGLKSALTDSRLYLLALERALLHQMPSGPWEGASHFQSIRLAGTEFFGQSSDNALFQHMLDRLAEAFNDQPSDYGSSEHEARLWSRCQQSSVWKNKHAKVRMGRWYDLFDKEADLEPGHWE
eukprot:130519-Amphidinium_carterae.1